MKKEIGALLQEKRGAFQIDNEIHEVCVLLRMSNMGV
jgi:hypothetical protein